MKNYLILFIFSIIFAGCATIGSLPNLTGTPELAFERDKGEFLELNSGTIIEGKLENTPGGRGMEKTHFGKNFTIDGNKYYYNDVLAFQNGNKYYRKSNYKKLFAERIFKGKINGYRLFDSGEATNITFYRYFIQKGDKSSLFYYDSKTLKSMTEDYEPAMDVVNRYNALSKKQKQMYGSNFLMQAIAIYNNR